MPPVTIKICCMQNAREVEMALSLGADYLGFISAMPSGFGPIPEDRIVELTASLPFREKAILLTSLTDPSDIILQQQRIDAGTIQLCARLQRCRLRELRAALPGVRLMPVVHVDGHEAVDLSADLIEDADMLLLDSGTPFADTPVLGGTGMTHDWNVSRKIVERSALPVWLAGGLDADNVAEAITTVRPAGVDVCTGVRTNGNLDRNKLERFIHTVRNINHTS